MDPIPIPKQAAEKMKEETPPPESAAPVPSRPPLAEKILRATQETDEDAGTAALSTSPSPLTTPSLDENQETDLWWGSYAGRAMAPGFIICALLTGLLIWGVWLFWPKNEDRPYL